MVKTLQIHVIFIGCGPLPVTLANEGLQESPTKDVIIPVVTVTGRGVTPKIFTISNWFSNIEPPSNWLFPEVAFWIDSLNNTYKSKSCTSEQGIKRLNT